MCRAYTRKIIHSFWTSFQAAIRSPDVSRAQSAHAALRKALHAFPRKTFSFWKSAESSCANIVFSPIECRAFTSLSSRGERCKCVDLTHDFSQYREGVNGRIFTLKQKKKKRDLLKQDKTLAKQLEGKFSKCFREIRAVSCGVARNENEKANLTAHVGVLKRFTTLYCNMTQRKSWKLQLLLPCDS